MTTYPLRWLVVAYETALHLRYFTSELHRLAKHKTWRADQSTHNLKAMILRTQTSSFRIISGFYRILSLWAPIQFQRSVSSFTHVVHCHSRLHCNIVLLRFLLQTGFQYHNSGRPMFSLPLGTHHFGSLTENTYMLKFIRHCRRFIVHAVMFSMKNSSEFSSHFSSTVSEVAMKLKASE